MIHATRLDALQYLNRNYGRGDIRQVRDYMDGRHEFVAQLQYGTVTRAFTDDGRTVRACGHQARYGVES